VWLYALAALYVAFVGAAVRAAILLIARRHDVHMVDGLAITVVVLTVLRRRCLRSCSMSAALQRKGASGP
jgi:hypothetical protein